MMRSAVRALGLAMLVGASPALAQTPGQDENDCKPSPLMSRLPGCGIYECTQKQFDGREVVINKDSELKTLEGEVDELSLVCPANSSPLQVMRNAEAALRKAGYTIVFSGKHEQHDQPTVTGQKGAQWVAVQTDMYGDFPVYKQTGVLVKPMVEEMTASAQAMADAIADSGRLDVYGITFATGQAAITPPSNQVLSDVLAVLAVNADWKLRIEGHTDDAGDKAANLNLSNARAAAVASWLIANGIDAGRLSIAGLGDTQPVADNATEDGRARNRRVVLVKQ
jgi:OmpA-OmpF porin, OOP family